MNPLDTIMQLGLWGKAHPTEVLLGFGAVPLLAGKPRAWQLRHRRGATTTHGSARWATPREVRQAGLYATHGVVVGRLRGRVLMDDGDTHILLCAPTGAGKGVGVIIPTLLTWQESAIVLDPKDGQNADVTRVWRTQYGQTALFTPCRAPHTCLNVLDTIRLKTLQEFRDAQLIAQSLVAPEKFRTGIGDGPALSRARGLIAHGHDPACLLHQHAQVPGGGVGLLDATAHEPGRRLAGHGHDGAYLARACIPPLPR